MSHLATWFLGVGVVLGLVVYGWSRGWAPATVRVGFDVVLGLAMEVVEVGVLVACIDVRETKDQNKV